MDEPQHEKAPASGLSDSNVGLGLETLHIYAQEFWHGEAYIAGTPLALKILRDAIDLAMGTGIGKGEFFTCDGEGYTVHVVQGTEDCIDEMPVPYTDECARAQPDRMKYGPWAIVFHDKEPTPNVQIEALPASGQSLSNAGLGVNRRKGKHEH